MKYIVKFQMNSGTWPYMTRKMIAFSLILLEQKIRAKLDEIRDSQKKPWNKHWHATGGFEYREYSKRDYLIDLIEDIINNPDEFNSEFSADEIMELLLPGDEE
jgi:hypothetical protein